MPKVTKTKHKRSIFACMKCHKSKMKCDIMTTGNPCSRCRARGDAECELFPSKRLPGRQNTLPAATANVHVRDNENPPAELNAESADPIGNPPTEQHEILTAPPQDTPVTEIIDNDVRQYAPAEQDPSHRIENDIPSVKTSDIMQVPDEHCLQEPQSPSMLLSWSENGNTHQMRVQIGPQPSTKRSTKIDKDTLVYVGESSPLSFLVRHFHDSGHVTMSNLSQIKVPRRMSGTASSSVSPSSSLASSPESVASTLKPGVLDSLVSSYFHTIHPFYPVINRLWFAEKYSSNQISPLLLNAVCFSACYHCDQYVIFRTGYSSREEAKEVFYTEAKRLFDEEQEDDILIILQSAVLLSFYGGKPRSVWNNRSWLAIAVTIAEDLGLHRSTAGLNMNETDKSHLRMIWWCIVFRDFMTSLNFGRPQKTCDSRSDFELLTMHEFHHDKDPKNPMFGRVDNANCQFLVANAKLNMLMMKVFNTRYSPQSDPLTDLNGHFTELIEWKNNLPKCLDWTTNPSSPAALYTGMIYNHMIIFIFRPRMSDSEIVEMCSLEKAVEAASEIATLVGKLGVLGTLQIPQDMYSIIITAMALLMNDVQTNRADTSKLQLQICLINLTHAKENWDHAPWIVKFFERMLETPTVYRADQSQHSPEETSTYPKQMDLFKELLNSMEQFF